MSSFDYLLSTRFVWRSVALVGSVQQVLLAVESVRHEIAKKMKLQHLPYQATMDYSRPVRIRSLSADQQVQTNMMGSGYKPGLVPLNSESLVPSFNALSFSDIRLPPGVFGLALVGDVV